jgi:hypothetical protein
MKFQIPQFIETEDKIIGPFSLKQFMFLAIGGVFVLTIYFSKAGTVALVLVGAPIMILSAMFAFGTVNGRPFQEFVLNFFKFNFKEHVYTWQKKDDSQLSKKMKEAEKIFKKYDRLEKERAKNPAPASANLSNISWVVNVKETEKK